MYFHNFVIDFAKKVFLLFFKTSVQPLGVGSVRVEWTTYLLAEPLCDSVLYLLYQLLCGLQYYLQFVCSFSFISHLLFLYRPTPVTERPSDLCMSKRRSKTTSGERVRKSQKLLEKQVKKLSLSDGIDQNPYYQIESEEIESNVYSARSERIVQTTLILFPLLVTLILVTRQAWQTYLVAQEAILQVMQQMLEQQAKRDEQQVKRDELLAAQIEHEKLASAKLRQKVVEKEKELAEKLEAEERG